MKEGSPSGSGASSRAELVGADQELALIINHELDLEQELEEVKQREAALRTEFDALKQVHDEREKLLSRMLADEKAKEQAVVDAKRAEMRMLREVQRLQEQLQQLQVSSK
jgi:chromosome segregation ATPase